MLEKLKAAKKVVGMKQLHRALKENTAVTVFLADDADPRLTQPVEALCNQGGVQLVHVATMLELGQACGIEVGAAAAAIVH